MFSTEKLFSQPIDYEKKALWLNALGLTDITFKFREMISEKLLRLFLFSADGVQALLQDEPSSVPEVKLCHALPFPPPSIEAENSLSEKLFPYPWSYLISTSAKVNEYWEFSDTGFQTACSQLAQKVLDLEKKLKQSELGCIQVQAGDENHSYLFHFVSGKILQSGYARNLDLNSNSIRQKVASITWAELEAANPSNLKGFDLATLQIAKSIQSAQTLKGPVPALAGVLELPLEL